MMGMCELDDDTELEPGDVERMVGFFAFGMVLADLIAHPEGVRKLTEALHG